MLLSKILRYLKIIINTNLDFKRVQENKFLVFDNELAFLSKEILHNKKVSILHTRNESFNLRILIKLFFVGKLNIINYYCAYIHEVKPKLIITFIDNNLNFYKLKKYFKNITFIAVQNGHRMEFGDMFGYIRSLKKNHKFSKKNYSADFIFTFNKKIGQVYEKNINCKSVDLGSFKNNLIIPNKKKSIKALVYISTYRDYMTNIIDNYDLFQSFDVRFDKKYQNKLCCEIDFVLPEIIRKICQNANLPLIILGSTNSENERQFYKKVLTSNKYKFISKKNTLANYKILDKYEYIFSTYSTLGYEALGRNKKVCFLSPKVSKYEKSYLFGWPSIKTKKGFFYSNDYSSKEVKRLLVNMIRTKNLAWDNKTRNYKNKLMFFDYKNTKIKSTIKKKNY